MHHRRNFVLAHMCGAGALGNALSSQGEVLAANRVDEQELDFFGAGKLVGGFWRIGEHGRGLGADDGRGRVSRFDEARRACSRLESGAILDKKRPILFARDVVRLRRPVACGAFAAQCPRLFVIGLARSERMLKDLQIVEKLSGLSGRERVNDNQGRLGAVGRGSGEKCQAVSPAL